MMAQTSYVPGSLGPMREIHTSQLYRFRRDSPEICVMSRYPDLAHFSPAFSPGPTSQVLNSVGHWLKLAAGSVANGY